MNNHSEHIHILSTARYAPKHQLTNDDLEKLVETSDAWIISRTGIKNRFIAKDETMIDLAVKAAEIAIHKAHIDRNTIDLVVVATITAEQLTPSAANFVVGKLNLNHPHIMSFDMNAACSGFIYGLETIYALLQTGRFKNALLIGGEKLSNYVDYTDRNTCVLFGDGAGAMVLSYDPNKAHEKSYFYSASKSDLENTLSVDKYITMDGKKVYQFAVDAMQKSIEYILEQSHLTLEDIDIIIPHQANERIILAVSKNMKIPMDRFFLNIAQYGNTSAASIPISLDEYLETTNQKPKKVLLVGFGGGFTWGSSILSF